MSVSTAGRFFRSRPTRIVSWGPEEVATAARAAGFRMNAGSVG